jgi:hypothetical protein
VIDLEDTDEDENEDVEEDAESSNAQLADSSAMNLLESVNEFIRSESEEEINHDDTSDPKEENRVTYPRHYHQFAGNYSESDDYDQEDEEEANRHVAYEGMYGNEEGQGESDGEEYNEEPDEGVIEIASSDEEDEVKGDYDDYEEIAEVVVESSEEETSETEVLNQAVDQYIANKESIMRPDGDAEASHTDIDNERANEQDRNVLKVQHHFSPTNAAKDGNDESIEMASGSGISAYDHLLTVGIRGKVNDTGEEVEDFHDESFADGNAHADDVPDSSEEFARDTSDTDDMQMADDEHESIDTEDDKRSLAAASVDADDNKSSPYRVAFQERESLEHATKVARLQDDAPLNTRNEHDSDDEKQVPAPE